MWVTTFVISVTALILIFVIVKSAIKNTNIKDLAVHFGFIHGFDLSCSFYENKHSENHQ